MVKSFLKLLNLLFFIFNVNYSWASAWLLNERKHEFILQTEYKTLATFYKDTQDSETYISKVFYLEYNDLFYRYGKSKKLNFGFEVKWFHYYGFEPIYEIETPEYEFYETSEVLLDSKLSKYSDSPFETQFFVQSLFLSGKNFSSSIKPNITFYQNSSRNSVGINLLYGYGFKVGRRNGFINIDLGADIYQGTNISEKYDISLGFELSKKYMIMLQSFNRENSNFYYQFSSEDDFYNNIKLAVVYKYNKYLSIQSGFTTNLSERDKYISNAYLTSLEVRF